jgi:hypothetical protein
MLYIEIPKGTNNLRYFCKNCGNEKIEENITESILLSEQQYVADQANIKSLVTPNIKYDLTLPRVSNIVCTNKSCSKPEVKQNEVIYIKHDHENMKYIYYCCHCEYFWMNE